MVWPLCDRPWVDSGSVAVVGPFSTPERTWEVSPEVGSAHSAQKKAEAIGSSVGRSWEDAEDGEEAAPWPRPAEWRASAKWGLPLD